MVSPMDDTRATSAARFLPESSAVAAALGPGPLGHLATTGSTNADLADEARAGNSAGAVLVADHQSAGRGRLGRTWEADSGAGLLVSLRIPATLEGAGQVMHAVGAAARAAADGLCVDAVRSKWPNDLVVIEGEAPGKLAGLLAEFVDGSAPSVIVGVGINITPIERQPGATSIVACGGPADRDVLLAALLRELAPRLSDGGGLLDELRTHSATLGARVRVELPGGSELVGTAADLTDTGELVVVDDGGERHVVGTGDVIHLRTI